MNTLLLADGHKTYRKTLNKMIHSNMPGTRVLDAENGKSAVEILQSEKPQGLILELDLPSPSGLFVLRQAKDANPGIFSVILTKHDDSNIRDAFFDLGANCFLSKRTTPVDLVAGLVKKWHEFFIGRIPHAFENENVDKLRIRHTNAKPFKTPEQVVIPRVTFSTGGPH